MRGSSPSTLTAAGDDREHCDVPPCSVHAAAITYNPCGGLSGEGLGDHDLMLRSFVGTVAGVYKGGEDNEVEFMTLDGETFALETLHCDDVRAARGQEITHAREIA